MLLRPRAAVLLAVLVATVVALVPVSAEAAGKRTTLTIAVPDCHECSVRLVQATSKHVWETGRQLVGDDGQAVFRMARSRTHGMSFEVTAPWEVDTGAINNVVVHYAGVAVGATVSPDLATTLPRGSGCWSGTNRKRASLQISVTSVIVPEAHGNGTGPMIVSWLNPQKRNMGRMSDTYHGALGNQDAFYC